MHANLKRESIQCNWFQMHEKHFYCTFSDPNSKLYNNFWNIENLPFSITKLYMTDYDNAVTRLEIWNPKVFLNIFLHSWFDAESMRLINGNEWFFFALVLVHFHSAQATKNIKWSWSPRPLPIQLYIFYLLYLNTNQHCSKKKLTVLLFQYSVR